jgi:hypothetical protein
VVRFGLEDCLQRSKVEVFRRKTSEAAKANGAEEWSRLTGEPVNMNEGTSNRAE